ncbi:RCC1/BLIP-II [Corynespora cassiicola Philippines]|uniref:RCC1/BLIP-II n=1 Tax=Corynespora cassiicola Philippines TaxID=1448308 RepID=A0A2T2NN27_CORCC|nr:RCC1/BLIP-II [Corynespora cassiicola Philippines]
MSYTLYTFGSNGESQLGTPAAEIVPTPQLALALSTPLDSIHGGDNHSLLLTPSGVIYAAGDNTKGQLGLSPAQTPRLPAFQQRYERISFAAATCTTSAYVINRSPDQAPLLITEGTAQWGELGRGPDTTNTESHPTTHSQANFPHTEPLPISLPSPVRALAAGAWHYVALLSDNTLWGWGKSRNGQLGPSLTSTPKLPTPTRLPALDFAPAAIACGKEFTYLVASPKDGRHALLGADRFGLVSRMPPHVRGWKKVGATWNAVFVLFDDGRVVGWGKENLWRAVPEGLPFVEDMAVGSEHVLAVVRGEGGVRRVVSWGWGKHGNCGEIESMGCRNDMVDGVWNEIQVGEEGDVVEGIGAGFCTSFVLVKNNTK